MDTELAELQVMTKKRQKKPKRKRGCCPAMATLWSTERTRRIGWRNV